MQGVFRNLYGVSGLPYTIPPQLAGSRNLGFMVLPNYRAWVILASLLVCLCTWLLIERTRLGATLRAATENATLVEAFGINVPLVVTLTYGFGVGLAALAGVLADADLFRQSEHGGGPDHHGLRRRGDRRHGLDPGIDRDRLRARHRGGSHQGRVPARLLDRDLRRS